MRGLSHADVGGWGHISPLESMFFPAPSQVPARGARAYFQGQFLDSKKKDHCHRMLKVKGTMTHSNTQGLSPDSTEPFLKGMSGRVISKLTQTGAWWNSREQDTIVTIRSSSKLICPVVGAEEKDLFFQAQLASLRHWHLQRTWSVPETTWRVCSRIPFSSA